MIDLKELERRLDDALAKETKDSLSAWLNDQRFNGLEGYLGACIGDTLPEESFSISLVVPPVTCFDNQNENNTPSEDYYDLAA